MLIIEARGFWPTAHPKGVWAVAKIKKVIEAGPLVVETIYPAPNPRDTPETRAGKKKLSSQAQQRFNLKCAWQKLELLIAANFRPGDLWVTLTFDDGHLPRTRDEAQKLARAFFRRLRKARGLLGRTLRYLYTLEHRHGEGRWHCHALINATGDDYRTLAGAWAMGQVDIRRIRVDREKNYESLAKYMCKEQRDSLGQRLWSGSKNLTRPRPECWRVPDDTPLDVPKGATELASASERTQYGVYKYIKYLTPGWERGAVRARRKR